MSASSQDAPKPDNKGWIAPSKQKHSDRSPDMRGKARFQGEEFFISAWWRETNGEKILSLSLSPVNQAPGQQGSHSGHSGQSSSSRSAPSGSYSSGSGGYERPRQPSAPAPSSVDSSKSSGLDDLGLGDLFGDHS